MTGPIAGGDTIRMTVTPDAYLTVRYAGASGDFNPIHIDETFARSVGLPGRILHGLWTMAQVARAAAEAAGGTVLADGSGYALRSLSVQFRGMGVPGAEIVVSGTATAAGDSEVLLELDAVQGETRLIRRGHAELRTG